MAKILTEVDTFSASIVVPEDGDTRNAASVETPLQSLTNRTLSLKNRVDIIGAAETVTLAGPAKNRMTLDSPGTWVSGSTVAWSSASNLGAVLVDINDLLVHGAGFTSASVVVLPGAVRAGADRMKVSLYRSTMNYGTVTLLSADVYDSGVAAEQTVTVTPSAPHTIDLGANLYYIHVRSGSTGIAAPDAIYGGVICVCAKPLIA